MLSWLFFHNLFWPYIQNATFVYYSLSKEFLCLIKMCQIFLSAQLQDQFTATANKEFDPLGPLPHGWGKYH